MIISNSIKAMSALSFMASVHDIIKGDIEHSRVDFYERYIDEGCRMCERGEFEHPDVLLNSSFSEFNFRYGDSSIYGTVGEMLAEVIVSRMGYTYTSCHSESDGQLGGMDLFLSSNNGKHYKELVGTSVKNIQLWGNEFKLWRRNGESRLCEGNAKRLILIDPKSGRYIMGDMEAMKSVMGTGDTANMIDFKGRDKIIVGKIDIGK
jgi:hypothetical protein